MAIDSQINKDLPFWKWLIHSGDNTNLGASARKLTIPPFVVFVGYLHYNDFGKHITSFLYADLIFILLMIGLLRTEDLMAFILKLKGKDGTTEHKIETTKNENSTTIKDTTTDSSAPKPE